MTMKHMESVLGRYLRSKFPLQTRSVVLDVSGKKGMWTTRVVCSLEEFPDRNVVVSSAFGKTRKESLRNMAAPILIWNGKESLEELELEMDSLGIGLE
jgi:hypothetical protein